MNPDYPDYHIEKFWLDFKQSMNNFYTCNNIISRPIYFWSNNLNLLQKEKKYDLIETNIRDYMSLYAIDLLRLNAFYHIGILNTNIKRWNLITTTNKFDKCNLKYINIVFLLLDLYHVININYNEEASDLELFSMCELYIIHEDFTIFIDYAIKNNKPSIIDKINEYEFQNNKPGLINKSIKYIESTYNVQLSQKISAKKIFSQIKKI